MSAFNSTIGVSALAAAAEPRHRWYFFKEGFSPEIVRHAIVDAGLGEDSIVYDPFSGSGTTVLTACQEGLDGVGSEVNPFLHSVTMAKLSRPRQRRLLQAFDKALNSAIAKSPHALESFSTFTELAPLAQERGKWLFNAQVLRAFGGAWRATNDLDAAEQSIVRLGCIAAAMDVSNAVKDGKCLRFRKNWDSLGFSAQSFRDALMMRAQTMCEDWKLRGGSGKVTLGDSRGLIPAEMFDLCVTSPPYLNSFDYTDVYRPELFLGGFIKSMDELHALRMQTLRSHVQVKWVDPIQTDFGEMYQRSIESLRKSESASWSSKIPLMIQAYFEDMATVFLRLRARAKASASIWLVVSTSAYCGVEIPVDLILGELGARNGWYLREVRVLRHLRRVAVQQWHRLNDRSDSSGPYLRESVVILDASPRKQSRH